MTNTLKSPIVPKCEKYLIILILCNNKRKIQYTYLWLHLLSMLELLANTLYI